MDYSEDWSLTIHSQPSESGYYYTLYWNPQLEAWLYKALVFDVKSGKWEGPWGWSYDRIGPFQLSEDGPKFWRIVHKGLTVDRYLVGSRTQFYGQQFSK